MPKELTPLTSLRGIFALLVVFYHFIKLVLPHRSPSELGFVGRGYLAVDFFFVLSGFIMMHAYGEKIAADGGRQGYLRFLSARIARIYPLHVLMLALLVAAELARFLHGASGAAAFSPPFSAAERSPGSIVTNLLLLQSLHVSDGLTWNTPAWSISTEFYVYLLFPLLVAAIARIKTFGLAVAAIALVLLAYVLTRVGINADRVGPLDITYDFGYFRCLIEFCLGMCVYRVYASDLWPTVGADRFVAIASLGLAVVLQNQWHDVLALPLIALLILSVSRNEGRSAAVLSWFPLRRLGDASYSIYLVHVPIREIGTMVLRRVSIDLDTMRLAPTVAALVLLAMVFAVVVVSLLTWKWFELPARNAVKRILDRSFAMRRS